MNKREIEAYIHTQIPATRALEFSVECFSSKNISVKADFEANKNLHNTGFAGSISTVLIISGWLRVYHLLLKRHPEAAIVIKSCETNFLRPVTSDLVSTTPGVIPAFQKKLLAELKSEGKGTIEVNSYLGTEEKVLASFKGVFYVRV